MQSTQTREVYNKKTSTKENVQTDETEEHYLFVRTLLDLGNLARLEAVHAASRLPGLMLLWIVRIPVMILLWISFSILVSWVAYELTAMLLASFIVLFLLQAVLALIIEASIKRRRHLFTLPEFRAQASQLKANMEHDKQSE